MKKLESLVRWGMEYNSIEGSCTYGSEKAELKLKTREMEHGTSLSCVAALRAAKEAEQRVLVYTCPPTSPTLDLSLSLKY
jgi:hypothetical protein